MGLGLMIFVYPLPFNRAIDSINDRSGWGLPNFPEIGFRLGLDLQGGIQLLYQADFSEIPEIEIEKRMEGLRSLIEQRVDHFGVAEPMVQIKGDRLLVELAGIVDAVEAMRMIGETPFLEFKELSTEEDITPEILETIKDYNQEAYNRAYLILERIRDGADFNEMAKSYSEDISNAEDGGALGRFGRGSMVENFEKASFALEEGALSDIVETEFGYHIIKKTGIEDADGKIEASHILITKKSPVDLVPQWKRTELSGEHLQTARHTFDPNTRDVIIELEFTNDGAIVFEKITERNIGKPLAIFLDGKSIIDTTGDGEITKEDIYAPIIQAKIDGGSAVITGEIQLDTARKIVNRLRSGALPVPIELVSHQNVGPAMAMDSLFRSLNAGFIGFLFVILFILFFYRFPGLLASIALLIYVLLVLSIFKIIPVTLTLSGIAGFILSIGMAIDANILVFSRIREEMKVGRGLKDSIDIGFEKVWPSIRDGNFTTLIVAFILFFIGTSFVKGFALTLIIGILVSIFSALVITRYFLKSFEGSSIEKIKQLWR